MSTDRADLKLNAMSILTDCIKNHINDSATSTEPEHLAMFLPALMLQLPVTFTNAGANQNKLWAIKDFTQLLVSNFDGYTDFAGIELGINGLCFEHRFQP